MSWFVADRREHRTVSPHVLIPPTGDVQLLQGTNASRSGFMRQALAGQEHAKTLFYAAVRAKVSTGEAAISGASRNGDFARRKAAGTVAAGEPLLPLVYVAHQDRFCIRCSFSIGERR